MPEKIKIKKDKENQFYDIDRALELGYERDPVTGHMNSRDYLTGRILKTPAHESFYQALEDDKKLGYRPFADPKGNVYTISPNDLPREGFFSPNENKKPMILKSKFSKKLGGRMVAVNDVFPFREGGIMLDKSEYSAMPLKKPLLAPIDDEGLLQKSIAARKSAEDQRWDATLPPGQFELQSLNADQVREYIEKLRGFDITGEDNTEARNYVNLLNQYQNMQGFRDGGKSKIRIKSENKGKFTASAKRAGHSVQEHARAVLSDPDATALQKKRANFARNAASWNKEEGGKIKGCGGKIKMKK